MSAKLVDDLVLEFSNLFCIPESHLHIFTFLVFYLHHIIYWKWSIMESTFLVHNLTKNDVDTLSGSGAFPSSMLLIAAIISSLEIDMFTSSEHTNLFCNNSQLFCQQSRLWKYFWNDEFSTSAVSWLHFVRVQSCFWIAPSCSRRFILFLTNL